MIQKNYEVSVIVNGSPVKEYLHEGKFYIEGKENTRFTLRLRNNSWQRKLFVPTIDGLSVMDGKDGDYDSGGYIVNAHSTINIDGWRISDADVAEFYFSSPEKSYRKRMKKGDNLGVIGVAVFDEKVQWTPPPVYSGNGFKLDAYGASGIGKIEDMTCSMNVATSSLGGQSLRAVKQDLGTGWGDTRRSEVVSVTFERASAPDEVFEVFYNTRQQLEKMGVSLKKEPLYVVPTAFPGRYCEPPK